MCMHFHHSVNENIQSIMIMDTWKILFYIIINYNNYRYLPNSSQCSLVERLNILKLKICSMKIWKLCDVYVTGQN